MATAWEYFGWSFNNGRTQEENAREFGRFGAEGWELASVYPSDDGVMRAMFKRPAAMDWRAAMPTPAEVEAHAEAHPFLRWDSESPDDTMPAFGLWIGRRPGHSDDLGRMPIYVAARRLPGYGAPYVDWRSQDTTDGLPAALKKPGVLWTPATCDGFPCARPAPAGEP